MSSPVGIASLPEVIFLIEESPAGGFTARALEESIFTEANDLADLHAKVRDAVHCHFDEGKVPKVIRLHFVREDVIRARGPRETSPVTTSRRPSPISGIG